MCLPQCVLTVGCKIQGPSVPTAGKRLLQLSPKKTLRCLQWSSSQCGYVSATAGDTVAPAPQPTGGEVSMAPPVVKVCLFAIPQNSRLQSPTPDTFCRDPYRQPCAQRARQLINTLEAAVSPSMRISLRNYGNMRTRACGHQNEWLPPLHPADSARDVWQGAAQSWPSGSCVGQPPRARIPSTWCCNNAVHIWFLLGYRQHAR